MTPAEALAQLDALFARGELQTERELWLQLKPAQRRAFCLVAEVDVTERDPAEITDAELVRVFGLLRKLATMASRIVAAAEKAHRDMLRQAESLAAVATQNEAAA